MGIHRFTLLVLLTLLMGLCKLESQTPNNGSPFQFERLNTSYHFDDEGTGYKEVIARIRISDQEGARQWRQLVFDYKPFYEKLQITFVRTIRSDGRTVDVLSNLEQAVDVPEDQKDTYDEKKVALPLLGHGDVIEYDVRTVFQRPLAAHECWVEHRFQRSGVLNEELEISVPDSRKVRIATRHGYRLRMSEKNERRIYYWRGSPGSAQKAKEKDSLDEKSVDVQLTTFLTWAEVGRWYAELEAPHRAPTASIRAKVKELTNGVTTQAGIIEALYNFAARKIKYISLDSLGVGGYEPHSAEETLNRGTGDCKDKATLLAALLESEGLHASSVLVNTHRDPELDFPSPDAFNHVITLLQIGKKDLWMDPSTAVLPVGTLTYGLRGKEVLVVSSSQLTKTPSGSPVPSVWKEELDGSVTNDGAIITTVHVSTLGDAGVTLRQAFTNLPNSSAAAFVRQIFHLSIDDYVSDVLVDDAADTRKAFVLTFRLRSNASVSPLNAQRQLKLPLSEFHLPASDVTTATNYSASGYTPFLLGPPTQYIYRVRLMLPGRTDVIVPDRLQISRSYASYVADYRLAGNVVDVRRVLTTKRDRLAASYAADYESFRSAILKDQSRILMH